MIASTRDPSASTSTLWLIGADGSDAHELPGSPKATISERQRAVEAAWSRAMASSSRSSPPGRAARGQLRQNHVSVTYPQDVYVVGSDGSGLLDITNSLADESWPSWSPEGDRIAFAKLSPEGQNVGTFMVTDPDGSDPVTLTGALVTADAPVWSPDGRACSVCLRPERGLERGHRRLDVRARPADHHPGGRPHERQLATMTSGASWQRRLLSRPSLVGAGRRSSSSGRRPRPVALA
jgi:Tol biopolymer transport system component